MAFWFWTPHLLQICSFVRPASSPGTNILITIPGTKTKGGPPGPVELDKLVWTKKSTIKTITFRHTYIHGGVQLRQRVSVQIESLRAVTEPDSQSVVFISFRPKPNQDRQFEAEAPSLCHVIVVAMVTASLSQFHMCGVRRTLKMTKPLLYAVGNRQRFYCIFTLHFL